MLAWIVENTLVALVLCAALAVAGSGLRLRPATRHALWVVVLVKLVTPPVVQWADLAPRATEPVRALYAIGVGPVLASVDLAARGPVALPARSEAMSTAVGNGSIPDVGAVAETSRGDALPWARILGAAWLLGAVSLLGSLVRRGWTSRSLVRARIEAPRWLTDDLLELSGAMHVRPPRLAVVDGLASPCTGGLLKTSILWPAHLTEPHQRETLRPILAHELAHVRRRDVAFARFELVAALFWWWHPLFWFVRTRIREFAEQACDAWALRLCPGAPRHYADALLALRADRRIPPGTLSLRRRGVAHLRRRLQAIMSCDGGGPLSGRGFACALMVLLLALPAWSVQSSARSASSSVRQDPQQRERQQDDASVGRIVRVDANGKFATVVMRTGVPAVEPGARLEVWRASLTARDVDGEFVFCSVAPRLGAVVGEPVYRPGEFPQDGRLAMVRIRRVRDRSVAMELARGHRPIGEGMSFLVREQGEPLPLTIQVAWDGNVVAVGRSEDVGKLTVGAIYPMYPVNDDRVKVGELGLPLRPLPSGRGETWIADYSENRVVVLGEDGEQVRALEDVYGVWDAEPLADGHVLVTEFALNRVAEFDGTGTIVWRYDDLRNPHDADRLPNGNTLIADTFGDRVIEVDANRRIVWELPIEKPFDADRLSNGNTLISEGRRDRVIEVDGDGDIVWELLNIASPSDVDRLPDGHTLVASRTDNSVYEFSADGRVVWKITGLRSPSDVERLDDGSTLVAENGSVERFDREGRLVWKHAISWAVAVHRR